MKTRTKLKIKRFFEQLDYFNEGFLYGLEKTSAVLVPLIIVLGAVYIISKIIAG